MKHFIHIKLVILLICTCLTYVSCSQIAQTYSTWNLVSNITKYVTCKEDTVKMMISSADSICNLVDDNHCLESLNLYDKKLNNEIDSLYGDYITTIIKIYATYDVVTKFPINEADAAFAWHEIVKKKIENNEEKFIQTTKDILKIYSEKCASMSISEITLRTYREILLSDYRLISAYKKLYDCCNTPTLIVNIHDSYLNIFKLYRTRRNSIEGYWQTLPGELALMQIDMLDKRREKINNITSKYEQGIITIDEINSELSKLNQDNENWDINNYYM